jgi:hypothetical protein
MNARLRALAVASLLSFVLPWAAPSTHAAGVDYGKDVDVLLDAFEADAGALLKAKGIDWGKVRQEFRAASKKTKTDEGTSASAGGSSRGSATVTRASRT